MDMSVSPFSSVGSLSLSLSLILVLVYLWKKIQIAVAGAVEIPHPGLVIASSGVL